VFLRVDPIGDFTGRTISKATLSCTSPGRRNSRRGVGRRTATLTVAFQSRFATSCQVRRQVGADAFGRCYGMRTEILFLLALVAPVAADTPVASGFIASGEGTLQGTVTDADGNPLAKATVHVVSSSGHEQRVRTDARGSYRAELRGGTHTHVFIEGAGRIVGWTSAGSDVIEIHEAIPPAVAAKPRKSPALIPPYSDTAIDADHWTRAWLLLDVSERGVVTRVKLLNEPGHDLDEIAVRHALALRFEPAQNRARRPVRTMVLWTFEWPAYWWMRRGKFSLSRLPVGIESVPCRKADKPAAWDRDCSKPAISRAVKQPWIAKARP
jgi:hypothetical protein